MQGFIQQVSGLDGTEPPNVNMQSGTNKDGVLDMMHALLQDGSQQNMKALNNLINPLDDQIKVIVNRGGEPDQEENDDEDTEEEPIIVQMLESMFSRKLEISQQKEMGMNIDIDELAHQLKLEMWKKVAIEFENKINQDWEKRRQSFERLYEQIVNDKLRKDIQNFA